MNYLLVVDDSQLDRSLAGGLLRKRFAHHVQFAANGLEALEQIEAQLPLAVITDMQMPDWDGLKLTETIRHRFPTVPVILMTAYGSEQIAAEALLCGATDYVPKENLAADLCPAVASVLALAAGRSGEQRLSHCLTFEETHYQLDNEALLLPPLVHHLQLTAHQLNLVDDTDRLRLAKALFEALHNAIYHGNLELSAVEVAEARQSPHSASALLARRQMSPYNQRHVTVSSNISADEGRFTIHDEGPGFDTRQTHRDQLDSSGLIRNNRHGLTLIYAFMDEVRFNARGNEITLIKRRVGAQRKEVPKESDAMCPV